MLKFVAFSAKEDGNLSESDSECDDDDELDPKDDYPVLYDGWVLLSNDKLQLTKENLMLEAKISMLEEENKEEKIGEKFPPSEKEWF